MSEGRERTPVRDLAIGVGAAAFAIWITFFGSLGAVDVATLVIAVIALIWSATVDPRRLVDSRGRPHLMLFGLMAVGTAIALTAALTIGTGTMFLVAAVTLAVIVVGVSRAIAHGTGGK